MRRACSQSNGSLSSAETRELDLPDTDDETSFPHHICSLAGQLQWCHLSNVVRTASLQYPATWKRPCSSSRAPVPPLSRLIVHIQREKNNSQLGERRYLIRHLVFDRLHILCGGVLTHWINGPESMDLVFDAQRTCSCTPTQETFPVIADLPFRNGRECR